MARALHKTPAEIRMMDYWDFIDIHKEVSEVPDISEGFYLAFLKPKPKTILLGEGPQRIQAIEEAKNYAKRKRS
ncbi:MAG: hypothetical protein HQM10_26760 [Candidatus Riflebacteria bacterium]|nr:hypothetical protein [Candidatus Riflebacteria bacterium]